jgi:hypothetical protein
MTRRVLLSLCALSVAALPLSAPAMGAKKNKKAPVVKRVSPKTVTVGEKLKIRGKNFRRGKGKNKVFFVRVKGKGVASVSALKANRRKLIVVVPTTLDDPLAGESARFRVRILAKRFGPWSRKKLSPIIEPSLSEDDGSGPGAPEADCDLDGTPNGADTDDDNDLLADTEEAGLGTDPCNADSDADGAEDRFEYQSALDLNSTDLQGTEPTPYPGRRPFPNPLFPDNGVDFDGDGLTTSDEHALWVHFGGHQFPLNYSAGLKFTVDGQPNDGDRDGDDDGLGNWDESHGGMTPEWWPAAYDKETAYTVSYPGTDMVVKDTDGDLVDDGDDDQDHDGLSNAFEVARPFNWATTYISVGPGSLGTFGTAGHDNPWARVDPFNPCKPVFSATCHLHPPFDYYGDDEDWQGMDVEAALLLDPTP